MTSKICRIFLAQLPTNCESKMDLMEELHTALTNILRNIDAVNLEGNASMVTAVDKHFAIK